MKLRITSLFTILYVYYVCQQIAKAQNEQTEETEITNANAEEGIEEEESKTNINPDYSGLDLNYTEYPNGGILVQYTQNGLNYIVGMAEKAILKLMTNFSIPDTINNDFTLKNVQVTEFDKPKLLTKFLNQTGMEIRMVIPKMDISAKYSFSGGWVSSEGEAKCNIKNLVINILLRIEEGRHGLPAFKLPICEGKMQRFKIVFSDQGWGGTLLNTFRGAAESLVTSTLGDFVCNAARNATGIIETILVDPPMINPVVVCGPDIEHQKGGSAVDSMLAEIDGVSFDTNTNGSAYFADDEMILGLNSDFAYMGNKTGLTPTHLVLPRTQRMLRIAVKEILVNSFGVIAQENKYFEYNELLELSELPIIIRTVLTPVCPFCRLQMYAMTLSPLRVEMSEFGVKAFMTAFMQISATGILRKKRSIVEATFDIESFVHLVIDKAYMLVGSINMEKVSVKIINNGLAGFVDKPLNALLTKLIPKFIWPAIKNKIDNAINSGFKLPAVCGFSFKNTEITYIEGAVIVGTDFVYDLEGFVDRFMAWQKEMGINATNIK